MKIIIIQISIVIDFYFAVTADIMTIISTSVDTAVVVISIVVIEFKMASNVNL